MEELEQELNRLLDELAELDRCSADRDDSAANVGLMTIAKRGTKLAITEVRALLAQKSAAAG